MKYSSFHRGSPGRMRVLVRSTPAASTRTRLLRRAVAAFRSRGWVFHSRPPVGGRVRIPDHAAGWLRIDTISHDELQLLAHWSTGTEDGQEEIAGVRPERPRGCGRGTGGERRAAFYTIRSPGGSVSITEGSGRPGPPDGGKLLFISWSRAYNSNLKPKYGHLHAEGVTGSVAG